MLPRASHRLQRLLTTARPTSASGVANAVIYLHEESECSTSGSSTSASCRWIGYPGNTGAASFHQVSRLHIWSFNRRKTADNPTDATGSATVTSVQPGITPDAPPAIMEPLPSFPLSENSAEAANVLAEALDAVELSSIAAAKALAWTNASYAISGLTLVHESLGMPWWASIAVFNLSLRLITFPLMVLSQKAGVTMMGMNHKLVDVKRLTDLAAKAKSQEEHARLLNAAREEYMRQTKTTGNPITTALKVPAVMFLNGLVFISIYWGVTSLMKAQVPSLTTGGTLWFSDLTQPDQTLGLGIMCVVMTMSMIQYSMSIGGDMNMASSPEQVKQLAFTKRLMQGASLMFLPASYYVSAGAAVLWVSNSSFMVLQGLTMRNTRFRRMVGLPSVAEMKKMQDEVVKAGATAAPATTVTTAPPVVPTAKLRTAPPASGRARR